MSYSPVRSEDRSIRALLRRLDADPLHMLASRPDPLRDLREARMKVAARVRAAKAKEVDSARKNFTDDVATALADYDVAYAPGSPLSELSEDEGERGAGNGQLIVINDVSATVPGSRRRRLLILGGGLAVCSLLAITLWPELSSGPTAIELASSGPGIEVPQTDSRSQEAPAQPSAAEGIARFTIAAVSFADAGPAGSQGPSASEESPAKYPEPLAADTPPRLDARVGDHVALPLELLTAQGTGEVGAVVLRGLPADYEVIAATPSGDGSWVLSPDGYAAARIVVPAGGAGEIGVTAEFFDISARPVGSSRFILAVKPIEIVRDLDPQRARAVLARGQALLQAGDIAGARLLFELAAEGGVAEGAYALGETFDPIQLSARGTVGLTGDAARARFWYQYAAQRGVAAARERLAVLEARS